MLQIFFLLPLLLVTTKTQAWNTPVFSGAKYSGWTWTGAVSNDWNNGANWCGSYINGQCRGQSSAPTSTSTVVFNDACTTYCSPVLSSNVSVYAMNLQSNFTGTINQGSYTIAIGLGGYDQLGGTFNAGSGPINVGSTAVAPDFKVRGGTFVGGTGAISIGLNPLPHAALGSALLIENCTFTAPSGIFKSQNANVQILGSATFNHNSGTIQLESPQNFMSVLINKTLKNLKIGNAQAKVIRLFGDITIDGDLTLIGNDTATGYLAGYKIKLTQGNVYHTGYSLHGDTLISLIGTGQQIVDNSGTTNPSTQNCLPGLESAQTSAPASVKFVGNVCLTGGVIATTSMGTYITTGSSFRLGYHGLSSLTKPTYDAPQINLPNTTLSAAGDEFNVRNLVVVGNLSYTNTVAQVYGGTNANVDLYGDLIASRDFGSSGNNFMIHMVGTSAQVIDVTGSLYGWVPGLEFKNTSGAGISFAGSFNPQFTGDLTYTSGVVTLPSTVALRPSSTSSIALGSLVVPNLSYTQNSGSTNLIQDMNVAGNITFQNILTNKTIDGATINVAGNVTCTSVGRGFGGTATINFMGNGPQSLDASPRANLELPNVGIAKNTGTLSVVGFIKQLGTTFAYTAGSVDWGTSTYSFASTSNSAIFPNALEFGNVSLVTGNVLDIAGGRLIVRGKLIFGSTAAGKPMTSNGIDAYGDVTFTGKGYTSAQQIRMLGSNSVTLGSNPTSVERFPTPALLIAKTSGAVVTVANEMTFPGTSSINITGGSLDLGAAANSFTVPGSLTLASGTSVKLSGATLTVGGANVPAGAYSGGTIVP